MDFKAVATPSAARTSALLLSVFSVFIVPMPTLAQTPIDAGTLQQQMDRQRESAAVPTPGQEAPSEPATVQQEKTEANKAEVTVQKFRFEGNTLLSEEELSSVVASYLNRPLDFSELQNAAAAVGAAYRAEGHVVRSFLPKQDIIDGVVTIRVIEAKFGKVRIEKEGEPRVSSETIENIVSAQQKSGDMINTQQIDRALLLADDLPGVGAAGHLQQGDKAGETDLAVKTSPEPWVRGMVSADNEGARATGEARGQGYAQILSPLGVGDQTSVYGLFSSGLHYVRMEESLPVGYDGLRVGVNGSLMDYRVLPSEFKALDAYGDAASVGLQARYPLIRAREHNLFAEANYDHKYFNNDANGATASRYNTDSLTFALQGNRMDEFAGGGNSSARVGVTMGSLSLGTLNAGENPELGRGYGKMTLSADRQQAIVEDVSLYASLSGQMGFTRKLDTSEMFYLGGPSGVRAYPVSEGGGSSGLLATIEPRWRFADGCQLGVFYDHGYVGNNDAQSYALKGAGVTLGWQSDFGLNVKGTWAHRIGENPNPTSTGNDQDGSLTRDRFWITASWQF